MVIGINKIQSVKWNKVDLQNIFSQIDHPYWKYLILIKLFLPYFFTLYFSKKIRLLIFYDLRLVFEIEL